MSIRNLPGGKGQAADGSEAENHTDVHIERNNSGCLRDRMLGEEITLRTECVIK
jgi:hypothetical protein